MATSKFAAAGSGAGADDTADCTGSLALDEERDGAGVGASDEVEGAADCARCIDSKSLRKRCIELATSAGADIGTGVALEVSSAGANEGKDALVKDHCPSARTVSSNSTEPDCPEVDSWATQRFSEAMDDSPSLRVTSADSRAKAEKVIEAGSGHPLRSSGRHKPCSRTSCMLAERPTDLRQSN